MKRKKLRIGLTCLSALVLLHACKRDIMPPRLDSSTEARAAAAILNFSSGTPPDYTVSLPTVFTTVGGSIVPAYVRYPAAVASNGSTLMWVADAEANQIKLISQTDGKLLEIYGSGVAGFADGTAATAAFNRPAGIALGPDGLLYVADQGNHRIRTISMSGQVATFAGTGIAGFADGPPAMCKFNSPSGVAVDANGTVYVADEGNNMIRRIINKSSVTRWAGQLAPGAQNGPGASASFNAPRGIAVGPTGMVYVADQNNNLIRKITSGTVTTFAGSGVAAFADGNGAAAAFQSPAGVATDSAGNVYVADRSNAAVRKITPAGDVTTLTGHTPGFRDGVGSKALFASPSWITVDRWGSILIADAGNKAIRLLMYRPALKTVWNQPPGINTNGSFAVGKDRTIFFNGPGGVITKAHPDSFATVVLATGFSSTRITVDNTGNVIAIKGQQVIRISPSGVQTVLGTVDCQVDNPCVDAAGNVYLTALDKHEELRKISPAGLVTTIKAQTMVDDYIYSTIGWLYNPWPTWTQLAVDKSTGMLYVGTGKAVYRMAPDGSNLTLYYGGPKANLPSTNVGSPVIDPVTRAPFTTGSIWQDKTFCSISNLMCTAEGKVFFANTGFSFGFSPANRSVRNNIFNISAPPIPGVPGSLYQLVFGSSANPLTDGPDGTVDEAWMTAPFNAVLSADNKTIFFEENVDGFSVRIRDISALY